MNKIFSLINWLIGILFFVLMVVVIWQLIAVIRFTGNTALNIIKAPFVFIYNMLSPKKAAQ
jgi:hypothetical protein